MSRGQMLIWNWRLICGLSLDRTSSGRSGPAITEAKTPLKTWTSLLRTLSWFWKTPGRMKMMEMVANLMNSPSVMNNRSKKSKLAALCKNSWLLNTITSKMIRSRNTSKRWTNYFTWSCWIMIRLLMIMLKLLIVSWPKKPKSKRMSRKLPKMSLSRHNSARIKMWLMTSNQM